MISIIVPVYNVENYIRQCIESILQQTYEDFELLLIDDGSADLSGAICKEYEQQDKRIRYIWKKNGGVSSARNEGIKQAKGKQIAFVDSDDFIEEQMLEQLVKENNPDFSMCGYKLYDEIHATVIKECQCRVLSGSVHDLAKRIKDYLDTPFLLGPCFKLFKKEIIDQHQIWFPPKLSYGEDAIFVFQYLLHCRNVEISSYIGYSYRKHGKQTLNEKFLPEKIDINYQINELISCLLEQEEIENRAEITADRLLECFVSYEKELLCSENTGKEKRKIFYEKYESYKDWFGKPERLAQKLIIYAGKYKICYPAVYLLRAKGVKVFYGEKKSSAVGILCKKSR